MKWGELGYILYPCDSPRRNKAQKYIFRDVWYTVSLPKIEPLLFRSLPAQVNTKIILQYIQSISIEYSTL